jgi:hypothetical protein
MRPSCSRAVPREQETALRFVPAVQDLSRAVENLIEQN